MAYVKRFLCYLLVLLMMGTMLTATASAQEAEKEATNISGSGLVTRYTYIGGVPELFDGNGVAPVGLGENASLTLNYSGGIGSLYFAFNLEYGLFTVTDLDSGESAQFGQNAFLHEFADLEEAFGKAPENIKISFDSGIGQLNELFVFSPGTPPDFVQRWNPPKDGETDIVLFSTHGDDEHLFFAGLLPYYANEGDYQVQVVYMTDHSNVTRRRIHEMLNGLWAVGIRNYPVMGTFPDRRSYSDEEAVQILSYEGISEEELQEFVVENIRRFKPKVAVGHDLNGEYGHGQHMMYARHLTEAIENANDPEQFPESYEKYGTWDVPKTYLHLYPENKIVMDWDQPLENYDGMTAFQVSKNLGFACHVSQYWDFNGFYYGAEKAANVPLYSPREYGLYRSTVGEDVQKNDFFENVTTHAQDKAAEEARLAAEEEAKRQEEARLAAEAEAKREAERLEAERLRKEAEEARAEEEALLQLQQEAAEQEAQRRQKLTYLGIAGVITFLLLLGAAVAVIDRKNKIRKK